VQTTVVTQGPVGKQADGVGANEEQSAPKHPTETPHGPDLMAQGVIRSVHCNRPGVLELRVEGAKGSVSLYSNDAYKIDYRALNFTPKDVIHPCQDLEGALFQDGGQDGGWADHDYCAEQMKTAEPKLRRFACRLGDQARLR
jgi:hypothetical protein